MNGYMQGVACRGRKPKHLPSLSVHPRQSLLAQMMRERTVVRFLVAPKSFGKTTLAFEYAESIFSLEHVFWVDASDPCFLRDLDAGTLGSDLLVQSTKSSLVVFDDIPYLNSIRRDALSKTFDMLLERSWEVVATTLPTCDVFDSCQIDKIRFNAHALLVTDEEIGSESFDRARAASLLQEDDLAHRVPGIYWGGENCYRDFLKGIAQEDLPSEVLLPLFAMLVMGRGALDDISSMVQSQHRDTLATLAENHPYLAIDFREKTFEAAPFAIDDILAAFAKKLEKIAGGSRCGSVDSLAGYLGDLLVRSDEENRACALISIGGVAQRLQWLAGYRERFLQKGILLIPQRLSESASSFRKQRVAQVSGLDGWRMLLLGNRRAAIDAAGQVAFNPDMASTERILGTLLLAWYADAPLRVQACEALVRFVSFDIENPEVELERFSVEGNPLSPEAPSVGSLPREPYEQRLELLVGAFLCMEYCVTGGISLVCAWSRQMGQSNVSEEGDIAATLLIMALKRLEQLKTLGQITPQIASLSRDLSRCVADFVASIARSGMVSVSVWQLIEEADASGLFEKKECQTYSHLFFVRLQSLDVAIVTQRREYLEKQENSSVEVVFAGDATDAIKPRGVRAALSCSAEIPQLYIRLFGGLEAHVGNRPVASNLLRRQKVQTLCAILVLNRGKEISRSVLCESLWPDSLPEKARNNLYSTWSILRRALAVESGECPYLVRMQRSCKIDATSVSSDVFELGTLCDRLLFSPLDVEAFSQIYARITALYAGDLLPSEPYNSIVLRHRVELRTRLVDAFVAAASALYRAREYPAALQFARMALQYDETREDVYKMLIQVQIAIGQRSSAMQTFFRCRDYLASELGLDPSSQMMALYNQMLTADASITQQLSLPFS